MNKTVQIIEQALTERAKWKERGVALERPTASIAKYIGEDFHYISFTSIKKLGLNPSSQWATPLGIYAYPLGDEWFKKAWKVSLDGGTREQGGIPFATEQPYIQLFKAKASRRVVVVGRSGNAIENEALVTKALRKLDNTMPDAVARAEESIGMRGWSMQGDMRRLWLLTMFIAMETVGERGKMVRALKSDNQHIVRWSNMLVELGIDGVEDRGSGIIHPNEPHQAVFFRLRDVSLMDTLTNPLLSPAKVIADPKVSPKTLTDAFLKLRNLLAQFLGDAKIEDNDSKTLGGRIGDLETGELFGPEQIIGVAGDHQEAFELVSTWHDQLKDIMTSLSNDRFLANAILGIVPNGFSAKAQNTTKLKVFGNKLTLVAGKTRITGGSASLSKPMQQDVRIVLNSKSSTELIDYTVESYELQKINTDFVGKYPINMKKCIVIIEESKMSKRDILALEQGGSEELRAMVENIMGIKLGMELEVSGSFVSIDAGAALTGDENGVMRG